MKFDLWTLLGLGAQGLFFGRFFVQWLVSEKRKQITFPKIFWHFSIAGGALLLVYAIHQKDVVFILGQAGGLAIYIRNLMLWEKNPAARARDAAIPETDGRSPV